MRPDGDPELKLFTVPLNVLFRLKDPFGARPDDSPPGAGLLVRLQREHADVYPWVPVCVWLRAHRRDGDSGVVWLDASPSRRSHALSILEHHVEVREPPVATR